MHVQVNPWLFLSLGILLERWPEIESRLKKKMQHPSSVFNYCPSHFKTKFSKDSYLDSCSHINHRSWLSGWRQDIHCGVFYSWTRKTFSTGRPFLVQTIPKNCWLWWRWENVNKSISNVSIEPYEKEEGNPGLYNLMLRLNVSTKGRLALLF